MKPCNQSGKCCIAYADGGLSAAREEIDAWHTHRPDIARYVSDGEIWCHPDTGARLAHCPWLRTEPGGARHHCAIYADRPQDCRDNPVLVTDMVRDGCEMLEPKDLQNLRGVQRALVAERRERD